MGYRPTGFPYKDADNSYLNTYAAQCDKTEQENKLCFQITVHILCLVQWTQNNSELELRHNKRGREDENGKGGTQDGKESV
jgi:hypothetical protein